MSATGDWRDIYCGRETELRALLARYEEVATGKGPRLAVVLGDRGMGKTRLVQELYRALAARFDPQHYWPDASMFAGNNLRVAPELEDVAVRAHYKSFKLVDRPIPYLWWGFRLSDPDARNATRSDMASHRATLEPHLAPLRYARAVSATRAHMRQAGVDAASELGKNLLKAAVQAVPGFGVMATVVDLMLDYAGKGISAAEAARSEAGLRDAHRRADLLQAHSSRAEDIHERTLNDLGSILAPSDDLRPLPVVIFCDDAQFARDGGDTGALRFLPTLWERAHLADWPLLLILTHWSVDWHSSGEAPIAPSCAGALMSSARSAQSGLVIELPKEPALARLVAAGLSGLPPRDEQLLLAKADGNPQVLIELIELVRRSPAWRRAGSGELTVHAREEVERRTTRLAELILDRLSSDVTPEHVRQAVALSSVQGMEFLCALTEAAAQALTLGGMAQGLKDAQHAHRLVIDVGTGMAGFVQRAYHEAAVRLVGGHLGDPQDVERALLEAAIALIDDQTRWSGLEPNEQVAAWGVVIGLAEAHRDGAMRRRAGAGLLWLIEAALRSERGADLARAAELAKRFEAGLQARWALSEFTPSDVRLALRAINFWSGPASTTHLADMILVHTQTVAAALGTPGARHDVSVSLNDVGRAAEARGALAQAEAAYRECLAIRRELAAELPTPQALVGVSESLHNLGTLAREQGDWMTALEMFRESLSIRGELAKRLGTIEARRDHTEALDDVGSVASAQGDWSEADEVYGKSLALRRESVAHHPTVQERHDLAVALTNIGRVARAQGDLAGADVAWREAMEISRELAADLRTPAVQRSLAVSLDNVGYAAHARREWPQAETLYRESLTIRRGLAAQLGTPEALRDLSVSLTNIGAVAREQGHLEAAQAGYRESLAVSRGLAAKLDTPEVRRDIAVTLYLLAELLRDQGQAAESCRLLREAQPILDGLAALRKTVQAAEMAREVRALIVRHCGD